MFFKVYILFFAEDCVHIKFELIWWSRYMEISHYSLHPNLTPNLPFMFHPQNTVLVFFKVNTTLELCCLAGGFLFFPYDIDHVLSRILELFEFRILYSPCLIYFSNDVIFMLLKRRMSHCYHCGYWKNPEPLIPHSVNAGGCECWSHLLALLMLMYHIWHDNSCLFIKMLRI